MGPVGLGNKNDCAGEGQQQFIRPTGWSVELSQGSCVVLSCEPTKGDSLELGGSGSAGRSWALARRSCAEQYSIESQGREE
jgi:hypothetical protein